MRQAAVGYQCPECVAEGRRSTRQPRTAYGGLRSGNPGLTSVVLIGINAAVWLLILATGRTASVWYQRLALLPAGQCAGAHGGYYPSATEAVCQGPQVHWVPGVADGAYWQLATSVFTQVGLLHIGFNMLALWFLGPQLEAVLGRARFLTLYLLSGLVGSVAVYWLSDPHVGTIGASGAIFGLLGGLLVIVLKVGGNLQPILVWLGINLLITVTGPNISWQGHLGGLVGGAAIAALMAYAPRPHRTTWQIAGSTVIGVACVALTVLRTLTLT